MILARRTVMVRGVLIGRKITSIHGAGGFETREVIEKLIVSRMPRELWSALNGSGLDVLEDGSTLKISDEEYLVVSTDNYTVKPLFFPGGDIGHLAASGVLNDLVVMNARPIAFMDGLIVEEGFPRRDLEKIIDSMTLVLKENNVALIGGDFKVMPRGSLDGVVISGTGIGLSKKPLINDPRPGDKVIVTGPIAEHGATILAAQMGMLEEAPGLHSDSKPLVKTVLPVIEEYRDHIHAARDPTRGGLSVVLNELVYGRDLAVLIHRSRVPVREEVRMFLDALGIDPLNVASEGVAVIVADPSKTSEVLEALHDHGEKEAVVIGEILKPENPIIRGRVIVETEVGGKTILQPNPLNLPRIC